jgi:hypothetical protein
MRFLSAEWFEAVSSELEDIALDQRATCRLNFSADTARWHLCIDSGRVTSFGFGHIENAHAELQWSPADAQAIVGRVLRGNDALLRTTVVCPLHDGSYVGVPAPLNLKSRPELGEMQVVPGATVKIQYRYRCGPFGDVDYWMAFVDGQCVSESLGEIDDAMVTIDVTYRAMALTRAGEITILEALVGGNIEGSEGALALVAGIREDPHYHAAELATGRHAIALAALGDLDADDRYAKLMAGLAATTDA